MTQLRLRLVKVIVQPVVVLDDGDLAEHPVSPIEIPAAQWAAFQASGFEAALSDLAARLGASWDGREGAAAE